MRSGVWLVPAALTEVSWIAGVKTADTGWQWAATIVCVLASLGCALKAARTIPMATVYVAFVGLGTAGTVALDIIVFQAQLSGLTYACLALVLTGVVGLQLLDDQ